MIDDRIMNILLNSIIGDALGSTFDGLSRGHTASIYRDSPGYFDPPVKKTGTEKWKKPGLYTSMSQLMLISSMSMERGRFKKKAFIENIRRSPKVENTPWGIFRHTGMAEKKFLDTILNSAISPLTQNYSSARLLPPVISLSFGRMSENDLVHDSAAMMSLMTMDYHTISGGILLSSLLNHLLSMESPLLKDLLLSALSISRGLRAIIEKNSPDIFSLRLNPDMLSAAADSYSDILSEIIDAPDKLKAEEMITRKISRLMNSNVKKASLDHPLAILPYTLYLFHSYQDDEKKFLHTMAKEGGAASALTSIAGAVSGAFPDNFTIQPELTGQLVNKKKIASIVETIVSGRKTAHFIEDFLISESLLTKKEMEEFNAKQKKDKKGAKSVKNRKNIEKMMTTHVVESWTKLDKARWKKTRKNMIQIDDSESDEE